jgi:hypothetical protein
MLRRVALVITDVSEDRIASIIRVTRIGDLGKTLAVTTVIVFLRIMRRFLVTGNIVSSSPILVTLMMEAMRSSETSVITRATRRNIPDVRRQDAKCLLAVVWLDPTASPNAVDNRKMFLPFACNRTHIPWSSSPYCSSNPVLTAPPLHFSRYIIYPHFLTSGLFDSYILDDFCSERQIIPEHGSMRNTANICQ